MPVRLRFQTRRKAFPGSKVPFAKNSLFTADRIIPATQTLNFWSRLRIVCWRRPQAHGHDDVFHIQIDLQIRVKYSILKMRTEIAQPTVYVIAGPNGAGKTTFAASFLPDFVNCREFVNADLIAAGLSPFDPDSQAIAAGRLMLQRIAELVHARQSFGFEKTLAGRTHARRLISMKSEAGYRVVLFFLWLETVGLAISRVAFRVREGGHHIPAETVKRRFRLGISNFGKLYRNLADDWYIIDGSKATPSIVCRGNFACLEILDSKRLSDIRSISPELVQ